MAGVMEKVNFSQASLLLFLEGENSEGSAFSESNSSLGEGSNERLPAVFAGDIEGSIGLPLSGELFARNPDISGKHTPI